MLSLLAAACLAAAPATGLTLSAQIGKATTPVSTLLDGIEQELLAGKLPVRRLGLACDGERDCLLKGAKAAGLPGIVSVSVAYAKKQATLDLEALRASDGVVVGQLTFSVIAGRFTEANREALRRLAAQMAEALTSPKSDTPVVEVKPKLVADAVVAPPPELVAPAPAPAAARRSKVPAWVLGGAAVASGVTSAVFLGVASDANGRLNADPNPMTRAEAELTAAAANRDYTLALATGLAAGALATGAILWLVTE